MGKIKKHGRAGPEAIVQARIIAMLRSKGWYVRETHGNIYQTGFPDLFACSSSFGWRWIEVKDPNRKGKASLFTPAQMEVFPRFAAEGIGIWILIGASDVEYNKLFSPANWWSFLQ